MSNDAFVQVGGIAVSPQVMRNLPHMPGFALPVWKDKNEKSQNWGIFNGVRIESQDGCPHEKQKFVKALRPKDSWNSGSMPDSHSRRVFKNPNTPRGLTTPRGSALATAGSALATPRGKLGSVDDNDYMEVPAWDALDRHVLRFYGYFKEAVVETNLENYRVRKVVINFFLEDDTCAVSEPREDNSGMPQGTLIRRHKFPGAGGGYLKAEELRIGSSLGIYGKTFRITSCDPFTREYFAHLGIEQDAPLPEEVDPFLSTREALKAKPAKQPRTAEKIFREVMLGGGHINSDMQQFLENDRKVLRFYAVLDDLSTPTFERRPFMLLFFLADDTMEIREMYGPNCGRDNFPIFFRRGKMKRGRIVCEGPQGPPKKKEDFVHGNELYVGQTVTLSGNQFLIYDVDPFTRKYFDEELGQPLEAKWDVQLPERAVPRAVTPPYTGYGSWDDSMASVTHLIPKPPKKDFVKLFMNEGKILRFTAKFTDPRPEDQSRLFVFNFHLFDDTLSIHEPPQRNLGIVTGRFCEKGVHMNQQTGEVFKAEDLLPGSTVLVYQHRFEMLDMDEYTRKTLEDPAREHAKFDLAVVMEKIRESMRQQFPLVRDIFRRFDTDHDGVLTLLEFKDALAKYGFNLSEQEVIVLMKHFDKRKDGQVSYNEFCDTLLDEDYTTEMLKTKPHLDTVLDTDYHQRAFAKSSDRTETRKVRTAVRDLGDRVYQRRDILHKLFKEFEKTTHEHIVSDEQIKKALQSVGITFALEDIDRVILYIYPDGDMKRIPYVEFFKALMASFHDMSGVR